VRLLCCPVRDSHQHPACPLQPTARRRLPLVMVTPPPPPPHPPAVGGRSCGTRPPRVASSPALADDHCVTLLAAECWGEVCRRVAVPLLVPAARGGGTKGARGVSQYAAAAGPFRLLCLSRAAALTRPSPLLRTRGEGMQGTARQGAHRLAACCPLHPPPPPSSSNRLLLPQAAHPAASLLKRPATP
jgi:hypothetical protein